MFHAGHIDILEKAKTFGTYIIVGNYLHLLNSTHKYSSIMLITSSVG